MICLENLGRWPSGVGLAWPLQQRILPGGLNKNIIARYSKCMDFFQPRTWKPCWFKFLIVISLQCIVSYVGLMRYDYDCFSAGALGMLWNVCSSSVKACWDWFQKGWKSFLWSRWSLWACMGLCSLMLEPLAPSDLIMRNLCWGSIRSCCCFGVSWSKLILYK